MALARVKTWVAGDTLTAADLNAEFNNILNNALSLISPLAGTLAFSGSSPFSVANGQTLTISIAAQTVGAATLTIPNFASVADTFAFITLAQTLSNKTLSAPTFSGAYTLGGTPTFGATMAGASTFSGAITLSAAGTALTVTNNTQIGSLGIGVAPSGTAGRLTVNENLIVSGAGPHAIGGATSADRQLFLRGSLTGSVNTYGLDINSSLTVPATGSGALMNASGTLIEAASGVHTFLAGLDVNILITDGAATTTDAGGIRIRAFTAAAGTTNASGLKVDVPTGATNNYALWASSGLIRTSGVFFSSGSDSIDYAGDFAINSAAGLPGALTERMRLTSGGILALGTTFTTGGAAGNFIIANNVGIAAVNFGGNALINIASINASNQFQSLSIRDNTTASAANVFVDSTSGAVLRSTSSRLSKTDIAYLAPESWRPVVLGLRPASFQGLHDQRHSLGFIAEDVAGLDPRLVTVGPDGAPDYVQYDRIPAYLTLGIQNHEQRLQALEALRN